MTETIRGVLDSSIEIAHSPAVRLTYTLEEIQKGVGMKLIMAAGYYSSENTVGCTWDGEPIEGKGEECPELELLDLAIMVLKREQPVKTPADYLRYAGVRDEVAYRIGRLIVRD